MNPDTNKRCCCFPWRTTTTTAAALAELLALGIDDQTARSLVARHSPARIHDVAAAAPRRANRNQAGWAVRALEGGWALDTAPPPRPAAAPVPPPTPDIVVAADDAIDDAVEARWRAWDQAVSDALSDEELPAAVEASCATLPASGRIVPAVRAQLIRWAAAALDAKDGSDLRRALLDALSGDARRTPGDAAATRADEFDASRDNARPAEAQLRWPPATDQAAPPLRDRLAAVLAQGAARAPDSRPTGFAQADRGEL